MQGINVKAGEVAGGVGSAPARTGQVSAKGQGSGAIPDGGTQKVTPIMPGCLLRARHELVKLADALHDELEHETDAYEKHRLVQAGRANARQLKALCDQLDVLDGVRR